MLGTPPHPRPSRWREPGFWSAVAGMAAALLIAASIVALEFIAEFGHIASHFRHRADRLQARVEQMEARLHRQKLQMDVIQRRADAVEEFNKIVAAPDSRLIRLMPTAGNKTPNATVVLSKQLAAAAINVTALPPMPSQVYELWWLPRRGAPILAIAFEPQNRGQLESILQLQVPSGDIEGAAITLAGSASSNKPVGAPILKGIIAMSAN